MKADLWLYEKKSVAKGFCKTGGVDEAGRGPLAGPVVSAAVILPKTLADYGITDSKKITPKKRAYLYEIIYDVAVSIGIGIVEPTEIDSMNIHRSSLLAMSLSVKNLKPQPDNLLIDGKFPIPYDLPQEMIIRGDNLSISVAAASIVAKVTRDRLMEAYHKYYPEFGFAKHKGYPTKDHKKAIIKYGCCPIHRQTYKGVKEYI